MRKNRTGTLKYTEYRMNQNVLLGKLRNRLIERVIEEDDARQDILHARFLEEIQRNIVPWCFLHGGTFRDKRNLFSLRKTRGS